MTKLKEWAINHIDVCAYVVGALALSGFGLICYTLGKMDC